MTAASNSRNPWPIAIVAWFITFGLFITIFIAWAAHQREDLVAANYYENEVRYQQQLDRLNQSQPLADKVAATYDAAQRNIVIALPAGQAREAVGRVHLYRPSDARLDRDVTLALDTDGVQRIGAGDLPAGLWKVRMQWSAGGKKFFAERMVFTDGAQTSSSARENHLVSNPPSRSSALR